MSRINQGVEFTEISCSIDELGWSECGGRTSCCRGLRKLANCANEGRKFGSLAIIIAWKRIQQHDKRNININLCKRVLQVKENTHATYVCQHSQIILATAGSTSLGISSRRFWKPTAPTTCIGFIPLQGSLNVASSHRMIPKL